MNRFLLLQATMCTMLMYLTNDALEVGSSLKRNKIVATNVYKDLDLAKLSLSHFNPEDDTYYLFSHGKTGQLRINGQWLDAQGVAVFVRKMTRDHNLKRLNIYGCEFGKGEEGRQAVKELENELGISVSASDDVTGVDGDWDLEVGRESFLPGMEGFNGNLQCDGTVGGTRSNDDFDGDGVCNGVDTDSDNDGVLNAVESPFCFYTAAEWTYGVRSDVTISSQMNFTSPYNTPSNLLDGYFSNEVYANNEAVVFAAATPGASGLPKVLYSFQMPAAVQLKGIYLSYVNSNSSFNSGTVITLQGSVDGTSWTSLDNGTKTYGATANNTITGLPVGYNQHSSNYFSVDQNTAKYSYYRLVWTGGGGLSASGFQKEFFFELPSSYVASEHPKPVCAIANHMDLDSDDDGCSDAVEAGVVTSGSTVPGPYGTNGFANNLETSENGVYTGSYTYVPNAVSKGMNCTDSDGDGIVDARDLDDDNDGISDILESGKVNLCQSLSWSVSAYSTYDEQNNGSPAGTGPFQGPFYFNGSNIIGSGVKVGNSIVTTGSAFDAAFRTQAGITGYSGTDDASRWAVRFCHTVSEIEAKIGKMTFVRGSLVDIFQIEVNGNIVHHSGFNATPRQSYNNTETITFEIREGDQVCFFYGEHDVTNTFSDIKIYIGESAASCDQVVDLDLDGDGIPNRLDLDSDGDGCSDAMEGGSNGVGDPISTTNLVHSSMPGGNSGGGYTGSAGPVDYNLGNTVDINGVPTVVVGGQALGSAQNSGFQPANCVPMIPVTSNDHKVNNAPGSPVTQAILVNDLGGDTPNPSTVNFVAPVGSTCEDTDGDGDCDKLTVPAEGVWTVSGTGEVTFTPETGFVTDPTPVDYTVRGDQGQGSNTSQISIDNTPLTDNDAGSGTYGKPVTVNVITNDTKGDVADPTTVQIAGTANPGEPLVVSGQGSWTVDPVTGAITFTPEAGYEGNPTPITYTVKDAQGNVSNASTVTVSYSPMPVTLVSFDANETIEGVELKWRTTDEKDFDRFEIERSAMPKAGFGKIGEVKGGGSQYLFVDAMRRSEASYYRLKMIDQDGTFSYSRIVTITSRNGLQLDRVYPNPSNGLVVRIATFENIDSFKVYDASGREVSVHMSGADRMYQFKFGNDASRGLYIISYKAGGLTISRKIMLNY